jgi:predicted transcriptional regulator
MADTEQQDLTTLTVDLLSAYFASNSIESDKLSDLIRMTHSALKELNAPSVVDAGPEHVPAVSARKSLASPDFILSMIDGKPYKTLKRHLGTHGLTPAEYRERYKLPRDYPLVAKSYSEHRRKVASDLGLGRSVRSPKVEEASVAIAEEKANPTVKAKSASAPKTKSSPVSKAKSAPAVPGVEQPSATETSRKATPKVAAKRKAETPAKADTAPKAPARKSKLSLAALKAPKAAS